MSSTSRNLDITKSPASGRRLVAGLYGKHPGWRDFVEGVGRSTGALQEFEAAFVVRGIGPLVDHGQWRGKEAVEELGTTHWAILRQHEGRCVVAVLAPSEDATGSERRRHPICLAADASGWDWWSLERLILPWLEGTMEEIRGVRTEAEVQRVFGEAHGRAPELMDSFIPANASARIESFLGDSAFTAKADTFPRILHAIRSSFEDVRVGDRGANEHGGRPHSILRLPLNASVRDGFAGWLTFLRGQIDNSVPVTLVRPSGRPWMDAFVGALPVYPDPGWNKTLRGEKPVRTDLRCIQYGVDIVQCDSEEPYVLQPEFLKLVPELLRSLSRPWGDPQRLSVFGPVPTPYRPQIPPGAIGGDMTLRLGVGLVALLVDRLKMASRLPPEANARFPWKAALGIAAGIAALVVVLTLWFGEGGDSPRKRGAGNDGSEASNGDSRQIVIPPVPQEDRDLRLRWAAYRGDFERWLGPLTKTLSSPESVPTAVRLESVRLRSGIPDGGLVPAVLYGNRDSTILGNPKVEVLRARFSQWGRAEVIRDAWVGFFRTNFPRSFRSTMSGLETSPFAPYLSSLTRAADDDLALIQRVVAPATNLSMVASGGLAESMERLAVLERSVTDVRISWSNWGVLSRSLVQVAPSLGPWVKSAEMRIGSSTNLEGARRELSLLAGDGKAVQRWLNDWWTHVETNQLPALSNPVPGVRLSEWTNGATEALRGFVGTDPRPALRDLVRRKNLLNDWNELSRASASGVKVPLKLEELKKRLTAWTNALTQLDERLTIRREEDEVRQEAIRLTQDWNRMEQEMSPAMLELFDFGGLVAKLRKRSLTNEAVSVWWSNIVERAVQEAGPRTKTLPREQLRLWRTRFEKLGVLAEGFDQLPPYPPRSVLAGAAAAAGGLDPHRLDALTVALQQDRLWRITAGAGAVPPWPDSVENIELKPVIAGVDVEYHRFSQALGRLMARLDSLGRTGVPAELNTWKEDFHALGSVPQTSWLNRVEGVHRILDGLRDVFDPQLSREKVADLVLVLPPSVVPLLMRQTEAWPDWPGGVVEWGSAVELYQRGATVMTNAPRGMDGAAWLESRWYHLAPSANTWEKIEALGAIAAKVPSSAGRWSVALAEQKQLADLLASYRTEDWEGFPSRTAAWLEQHLGPGSTLDPKQRALLEQISQLPSTNRTDWAALAPAKAGFKVTPNPGGGFRLVAPGGSLDFRLMAGPEESLFFVGAGEFPSGIAVRLLNGEGYPRTLLRDFAGALNATLDGATNNFRGSGVKFAWPVFGLSQWTLERNGGDPSLNTLKAVVRSIRWAGPSAIGLKAQVVGTWNVGSDDLPVNFLPPKVCEAMARVLGGRLPTVVEWEQMDQFLKASPANLASAGALQGLHDLSRDLDLKTGWQPLFFAELPPLDTPGLTASSGAPFVGANDSRFEAKGFANLRGNVAEYLADGDGYHVAGGSFITLPGSPVRPVSVSSTQAARGYFDVGFRMAVDWVGIRPGKELRRLIHDLKPDLAVNRSAGRSDGAKP